MCPWFTLSFIGTVDADWQYTYLGTCQFDIAQEQWTRIKVFGNVFNFTFCDVALTSSEQFVVIVEKRPLTADESNEEIEMDEDRIFVLGIRNENRYKLRCTCNAFGLFMFYGVSCTDGQSGKGAVANVNSAP